MTSYSLVFLAQVLCFALALGLPWGCTRALSRLGFTRLAGQLLLGLSVWITGVSLLALSGLFTDFSGLPPRPFFVLFPAMITVIYWSVRPRTGAVLAQIPPRNLIGIQGFRVPIELFLWLLYLAEEIPVQMTFEGQNPDILTGVLGLLLYLLWPQISKAAQRKLWLSFNLIGLGLLFNIVITALLSMPTALRFFMNEPANRIVTTFPFILLPTVLVPFALLFHLLSLRQFWQSKA